MNFVKKATFTLPPQKTGSAKGAEIQWKYFNVVMPNVLLFCKLHVYK